MTPPPDDQPLWRRDFPIDWPDAEWISRRELVKFLVLVSGAFGAGQLWLLWRSRQPAAAPAPARIAPVADVPVGGSRLFDYPEGGPRRILVRVDERTFVAYEQQCTHLTCPVVPAVERGELHCPCHHGIFDLRTGNPLAGPPRRPLARVTLAIENGWVVATGVEPRTA
jgi:nitrite reductase/ring-hydroxylating ferredoxin subunit